MILSNIGISQQVNAINMLLTKLCNLIYKKHYIIYFKYEIKISLLKNLIMLFSIKSKYIYL